MKMKSGKLLFYLMIGHVFLGGTLKPRIIKDDIRYLLFSEIYHRLDEPKARRRAFFREIFESCGWMTEET